MKRLSLLLLLTGSLWLVSGIAAAADTAEKVNAAVESATTWLSVVDSGKYAESWDETAAYFKKMVPKELWVSQLTQYRTPMGQALSRSVHSANYLTNLPDAGTGEYVVIICKVKMDTGKIMTETVTPMLDPDGVWRVSGYYIK